MTNNSVTLEQLNSMIDRLIEADGVIDDVENQRKALLEQAFGGKDGIDHAEVMSILTSLSGADGEKASSESTLIKEMVDELKSSSVEETTENKSEVEPAQESTDSSTDVESGDESPSDHGADHDDDAIPDSTELLDIDGDAHMWIKNLDLHYGSAQAIYNVSIPFQRNAVTALIGPSGCGKSTLLRCLNRMNDLIPICKIDGSIELDGEEIMGRGADLVTIRRRVGMVFQKPNPFPKSIYDNVAYGVRLHYTPSRRELDRIVEESLKRAAIWEEVNDRLHELGTSLSGGQQQRLCIARTIAVEPEAVSYTHLTLPTKA